MNRAQPLALAAKASKVRTIMDDKAPPPSDPIETIRGEIDGIDATLLSLVAERLQLADKLAAAKAPQAGLPIRPGREVALLRRLVANAPAPLERELVVELWRALIAASLRRQRVVDVAVGGGAKSDTRLFDIARRHFGARTRIQPMGEPQAALQKAAENPQSWVAVTPWPAAPGVGAWWPALTERRFHNLQLIAGLPLLSAGGEDPEAAVFAAAATEEAGGDVTVLLAFDPHHRVQRALNEQGLVGKEIARAEPRVLVRIDGFMSVDDPRAGAMTRFGLDSVRVLGSYARI
jgi:chorismate mutase/prephenate dehydratase